MTNTIGQILSPSEIFSERFLASRTQGFRWTRRTTVHSKPKPIWFPRAAPPLDGFGIGCRVRQASHASQAGWWRPTVALACCTRGTQRRRWTSTWTGEDRNPFFRGLVRSAAGLTRRGQWPVKVPPSTFSSSAPLVLLTRPLRTLCRCSDHPWRSSSHSLPSPIAPRRPNFLHVRCSWRGAVKSKRSARCRLVAVSSDCQTRLGTLFQNKSYLVDQSTLIECRKW